MSPVYHLAHFSSSCPAPLTAPPPQYLPSARPCPSLFSLKERDNKKRDLAEYHEWNAEAAAFEEHCARNNLDVSEALHANFDPKDHVTSKRPQGITADEFEKEYKRLRGGAVIMHTIEPVWTHHTGR